MQSAAHDVAAAALRAASSALIRPSRCSSSETRVRISPFTAIIVSPLRDPTPCGRWTPRWDGRGVAVVMSLVASTGMVSTVCRASCRAAASAPAGAHSSYSSPVPRFTWSFCIPGAIPGSSPRPLHYHCTPPLPTPPSAPPRTALLLLHVDSRVQAGTAPIRERTCPTPCPN